MTIEPSDNFFKEFGIAHFQAQRFEYDLATLLLMFDRRKKVFVSMTDLLAKDRAYAKRTLGILLSKLRSRNINLSTTDEQQLDEALDARN